MKKRLAGIFLTVLTVCAVILFPAVTAGAAGGTSADSEDAPWNEEDFEALTQEWGNRYFQTGENGKKYACYAAPDGTCSAMIGDDPITWIYIETIGEDVAHEPFWVGISNYTRTDGSRPFEKGSRFSVRFVGKADNPEKWKNNWDRADSEIRERFYSNKTYFCEISVTRPDGREYLFLDDVTELFISADIRLFDGNYEQMAYYRKSVAAADADFPESADYGVYVPKHFSEPFLVGTFDAWPGSTISDTITPFSAIIIGAAALVVGLVVGFLVGKKKPAIVKRPETEAVE